MSSVMCTEVFNKKIEYCSNMIKHSAEQVLVTAMYACGQILTAKWQTALM